MPDNFMCLSTKMSKNLCHKAAPLNLRTALRQNNNEKICPINGTPYSTWLN